MTTDQRQALLDAGVKVVHARGLGATGVRDISAVANVPPGSFTNHFRSKEVFGLLVLDQYAERIDAMMQATLGDVTRPPAARLESYFARISDSAAEAQWQRGCLVVDLAGEVAAHGDAVRERMCTVLARQSTRFEEVVRLLVHDEDEAADLGAFLLAAWQGTLLRMKVERGPRALDGFRRTLAALLPRIGAPSVDPTVG
ncbi:TetR/AcrR family transcriptional regulator [Sphingomonas nostoxanthinifaciens]|uniref:TetR/AcrR family transcriptional regulator n=1 Tax=Sphingomonas nostoxanthinifaciens TaxID=2872652 RepID=UPI001CC21BD2|nr:TetR/AcrR family transcriptional regulator [Sphingomonas nostoxanthinifaciens]UAK25614.1 TetR/AcrR family transcriptional regulator [Sphingomonas nostoxanthinifaciens]